MAPEMAGLQTASQTTARGQQEIEADIRDRIGGEIREVLEREARAWDEQDIDLLLSIFHPDMVWPSPKSPEAHDPIDWCWGMGRFDAKRWRRTYEDFLAHHELVHNRRHVRAIDISPEADGAFAVVDVDTLWRSRNGGSDSHWLGRSGKVFTRVGNEWKLIMHTGPLAYPVEGRGVGGT